MVCVVCDRQIVVESSNGRKPVIATEGKKTSRRNQGKSKKPNAADEPEEAQSPSAETIPGAASGTSS